MDVDLGVLSLSLAGRDVSPLLVSPPMIRATSLGGGKWGDGGCKSCNTRDQSLNMIGSGQAHTILTFWYTPRSGLRRRLISEIPILDRISSTQLPTITASGKQEVKRGQQVKMSVTTTDNPISTTLHRAAQPSHLDDYEIHLTNEEASPAPPNTDSRPPPSTASYPPGWGTEHRGVPPYRPINTDLDFSQRPWAGNPVGATFVFTMFTGVFTVVVSPSPPSSVWDSLD